MPLLVLEFRVTGVAQWKNVSLLPAPDLQLTCNHVQGAAKKVAP